MPTPPVSLDLATATVETVEQCLREGFSGPGQSGMKGSAIEEAARRMVAAGLLRSRNSMTSRLRASERGFRPVDWTIKPVIRVKARRREDEPEPAPVPLTPDHRDEVIRRLTAELKHERKSRLSEERIRQEIFGLAATDPEPPDWAALPTEDGDSHLRVPITFWSDWHWGEVVRAVEVGGVNEFNLAVAHERAQMLVERVVSLCFEHEADPRYPGIVVALGGDMISGDIHEELVETNEAATMPVLWDLQNVLVKMIAMLADRFGRVFVPCVVGNHGRNTLKPRFKDRVHHSYEWLLYMQLAAHFAGDDRVQFYIPGETDAHFRVAGWRVLLTHGDALGSGGGDGIIGAIGPIMRGIVKTARSEAQIGRDFDFAMIGHWHQWMPIFESGVVVNGALKGYDNFARLRMRVRYQRPIQGLWFMHPRIGVQKIQPIYLGDDPIERRDEEFVAFPRAA